MTGISSATWSIDPTDRCVTVTCRNRYRLSCQVDYLQECKICSLELSIRTWEGTNGSLFFQNWSRKSREVMPARLPNRQGTKIQLEYMHVKRVLRHEMSAIDYRDTLSVNQADWSSSTNNDPIILIFNLLQKTFLVLSWDFGNSAVWVFWPTAMWCLGNSI